MKFPKEIFSFYSLSKKWFHFVLVGIMGTNVAFLFICHFGRLYTVIPTEKNLTPLES